MWAPRFWRAIGCTACFTEVVLHLTSEHAQKWYPLGVTCPPSRLGAMICELKTKFRKLATRNRWLFATSARISSFRGPVELEMSFPKGPPSPPATCQRQGHKGSENYSGAGIDRSLSEPEIRSRCVLNPSGNAERAPRGVSVVGSYPTLTASR